jgi:hypothetical protein
MLQSADRVDSKNHLIVNYLVSNEVSDLNQLSCVAISAKETHGVEQINCLSDRGYFDFMQIKQCADNGVTPYVAVKRSGSGGSLISPEFTADKFQYDKVLMSTFVHLVSVFYFAALMFVKGWKCEFTSVQRRFALHADIL